MGLRHAVLSTLNSDSSENTSESQQPARERKEDENRSPQMTKMPEWVNEL